MKTFISPPAETNWKMDAEQFRARLREFSRLVQVRDQQECFSGHRVEWAWSAAHGLVEGSLDLEGNCIVLDGDVRSCAEFAVWFRALVPAAQELVFYDEGYSADVMLSSDSSVEELVAPFLA